MLDVHAPHETVHTWKAFFIHIATIVIGLFIAVGLEQTVEHLHHRHVSAELEAQIREVFGSNVDSDAENLQTLGSLRAYLLEVQTAVTGRLQGRTEPQPPVRNDPRMLLTRLTFPTMAPYDAAKESGSIAYLPTARIRIYNRLAFQREILMVSRERWVDAIAALSIFNERYEDSPGLPLMGSISTAPDIDKLSHEDLVEYRNVLTALIKQNDIFIVRIRVFDAACQAVLSGAKTEQGLIDAMRATVVEPGTSASQPATRK